MPGLLRAVGRTAVVAGTATAVSNRVSRRQANRWQDQAAADQYYAEQAAPPPPAPAQDDTLERLKELGELKNSGVLTEAEFEAQKAKILAGL
jgi:phosphoglycolate phosphatase-like HAD superfamily hydrolase